MTSTDGRVGGRCSLEQTFLLAEFPSTGKNTGNFPVFCLIGLIQPQEAVDIPRFPS
jgi:hypothetical protein